MTSAKHYNSLLVRAIVTKLGQRDYFKNIQEVWTNMRTIDAIVFLISHDFVKRYDFISGRTVFSSFDNRIGRKHLLTNFWPLLLFHTF